MADATTIQALTQLLERKTAVKHADPDSAIFNVWKDSALQILSKTFGAESHYVSEFQKIGFQLGPELLATMRKAAKRVVLSSEDGKSTRINLPFSADQTQRRAFEEGVEEAAEILLAAKHELQKLPRK